MMDSALPPPVELDLDATVRTYWSARVAQHLHDSYLGVPLLKFPEDLRVYEHLLWQAQVNVVIEIGTHSGGSALWFRDRLQTFAGYGRIAHPRVISIDVDSAPAQAAIVRVDPASAGITLLEASVLDPALPATVATLLPAAARCMVVDDSAHTYETTSAALNAFARFVPVGGFFVVEDGCVDVEEMRTDPSWPRGVIPALEAFLATEPGRAFAVRRELERYGLTCHVSGYLERVGPAST
jgi:cephalosporin hydroxylase